jgi:hypothetical protein
MDMSGTTDDTDVGGASPSKTSSTARFRRNALSVALLVAPWGFVLGNAGYAWETRHGGEDLTGAGSLALAAAHPGAERFGMVVTMIGCLLMVPAAIGGMKMIHRRAAKLGLIGGVAVAACYVAYFAMVFGDRLTFVMAARGGNSADYAHVLDQSLNGVSVVWVYVMFLVGNLIGTFLFGLALLRSRTVPGWAAWGVLGWPILHVVGILFGTEWFEVAGALAQAIGFAGVGVYLRRQQPAADLDPALVRPPRRRKLNLTEPVPAVSADR